MMRLRSTRSSNQPSYSIPLNQHNNFSKKWKTDDREQSNSKPELVTAQP